MMTAAKPELEKLRGLEADRPKPQFAFLMEEDERGSLEREAASLQKHREEMKAANSSLPAPRKYGLPCGGRAGRTVPVVSTQWRGDDLCLDDFVKAADRPRRQQKADKKRGKKAKSHWEDPRDKKIEEQEAQLAATRRGLKKLQKEKLQSLKGFEALVPGALELQPLQRSDSVESAPAC